MSEPSSKTVARKLSCPVEALYKGELRSSTKDAGDVFEALEATKSPLRIPLGLPRTVGNS
jgi:hypothetical protein